VPARPHAQGWLIAPDAARFCDPRTNPDALPPFPAYTEQPRRVGPLPTGFPIRPRYATRAGGSYLELFNTRPAHFYATGEQAGPLLRNGTRKTLWNSDSYDYTDKTKSLYQSQPFVLGVRRSPSAPAEGVAESSRPGAAFGIIIETTYRCTIDLRENVFGIAAEVDGPAPAVTVILADSPQQVVHRLADLTGRMPLPPLWALGYHQCRYSYLSETQVREVAKGFRDRQIPCDAIWLDIDYMDGYRSFTFNKETFPNPKSLADDLHKDGIKLVAMIDPGLKVDDNYEPYTQGRDQGHFVQRSPSAHAEGVAESSRPGVASDSRSIYEAPVWPGPCAFPDFTNTAARRWFGDLYQPLLDIGIDGFWNDMNEPAVFVPSKTMPLDNVHDADEDLGGPGAHAKYHNIYGTQMARATREALERLRPGKRPFVLTRAAFLGSQRYAATWTGDNAATWDHLKWSIPMALNLSLSGQPFSGPDIGGFLSDSDPKLFARWMGIASLLPFCRSHKNKGTKLHEPWTLGEECEKVCRLALQRRYRLLPYLYTLFHQASRTGDPIIRPLFFADPADPRLRAVDDAFLLGDAVLVRANVNPDANAPSSPLPRGDWRPFEVTDPHPELPQLLLRAGSIVPLAQPTQHTRELVLDPLTLLAAYDASGHAAGALYEDAGDGLEYEAGQYTLTTFEVSGDTPVIEAESNHKQPDRRIEVQLLS
jgi:alpha-glucosidase